MCYFLEEESENKSFLPLRNSISIDSNFQNEEPLFIDEIIIDKKQDDMKEYSLIISNPEVIKSDKNEETFQTPKTKKTSNNSKYDMKYSTEKFNSSSNKGRKRKRDNNREGKYHGKNGYDNILRRIQVDFISFIIFYANAILQTFCNYKFLKIDCKYTKKVNKSDIKDIKSKQISEILCQNISNRFKKIQNKEFNKLIFGLFINENPEIKDIFSDTYINLFKNIYYLGKREITLKINGENKIISLKGIKMFDDFLKKVDEESETENIEYIQRIKKCVKDNFLN
jgi:hypothetical protein